MLPTAPTAPTLPTVKIRMTPIHRGRDAWSSAAHTGLSTTGSINDRIDRKIDRSHRPFWSS
jgi:hypothetical protein